MVLTFDTIRLLVVLLLVVVLMAAVFNGGSALAQHVRNKAKFATSLPQLFASKLLKTRGWKGISDKLI